MRLHQLVQAIHSLPHPPASPQKLYLGEMENPHGFWPIRCSAHPTEVHCMVPHQRCAGSRKPLFKPSGPEYTSCTAQPIADAVPQLLTIWCQVLDAAYCRDPTSKWFIPFEDMSQQDAPIGTK